MYPVIHCAYRAYNGVTARRPGKRSATGLFSGKKKPTLRLAQSMNTILFRVVRVVVFAAIAFSAVTVQVQAVVGQADAMTGGDFTLA
ncbi:Uncharacterised protein [Enterobacter hormaechei]|nr:Uncharacterised protein [Enterobacter hormaechei]VAM33685.1 Uncharacterised protein [Enterobacter hormaechei]